MGATSDGMIIFHDASGGFLGASESTIGDVSAGLAKVSGSLLSSGGTVVGRNSGAEIVLGGSKADLRIRTAGTNFRIMAKDPTTYQYTARFHFNDSHGQLYGPWAAERDFTVNGSMTNASLILLSNGTRTEFKAGSDATGSPIFTIELEGTPKLTMGQEQSQLHGKWQINELLSDSYHTVSDRRFKRNIKSLLSHNSAVKHATAKHPDTRDSPAWLLRQLRPVSYRFHRDPPGKKVNFADPQK
jgi:hypothetical protein